MRRHEGGRVNLENDVLDAADFEARDDAVENVAFFARFAANVQPAANFINCYAAMSANGYRITSTPFQNAT